MRISTKQVEHMVRTLEVIDWANESIGYCICCQRYWPHGHNPECDYDAAMKGIYDDSRLKLMLHTRVGG